MRFHDIKKYDMLNGDGLRTVIWVSGCDHHCPECQNPVTWDKEKGVLFDQKSFEEIKESLKEDCCSGITITGGDPFCCGDLKQIIDICFYTKYIKNKSVWVYTGYTFEELVEMQNQDVLEILDMCDVLVDGKYMKELRDVELKWRGSSNQRVIDVPSTIIADCVVLHCE